MRVMYQPEGIEMIGFGSMDGVAILQTEADLPREALEPLFQLGFFCSPVVIVWQVGKRYSLGFQSDRVVHQHQVFANLVKTEKGWEQAESGLRLFSPESTQANLTSLKTLLKDCQISNNVAF